MKIRHVTSNNRRRAFDVQIGTRLFAFPYANARPEPGTGNYPIEVFVDRETGSETFTYRLVSGEEGFVHVEQVLEYNRDPDYLRDQLLYDLTLKAQQRMAESALSKREIMRRLSTSPAQFYRLMDQTNREKSVDKMLALLRALDCEVDVVVRAKSA